jgi:hypothetical protein
LGALDEGAGAVAYADECCADFWQVGSVLFCGVFEGLMLVLLFNFFLVICWFVVCCVLGLFFVCVKLVGFVGVLVVYTFCLYSLFIQLSKFAVGGFVGLRRFLFGGFCFDRVVCCLSIVFWVGGFWLFAGVVCVFCCAKLVFLGYLFFSCVFYVVYLYERG